MSEFKFTRADLEVDGFDLIDIDIAVDKCNAKLKEWERDFMVTKVAGWTIKQIMKAQNFWRMHHLEDPYIEEIK